jgi:hypothetical protein
MTRLRPLREQIKARRLSPERHSLVKPSSGRKRRNVRRLVQKPQGADRREQGDDAATTSSRTIRLSQAIPHEHLPLPLRNQRVHQRIVRFRKLPRKEA